MTPETGIARRRAFTLIELLLATTMMVLVLSFVVIGVEGLVPAYRVEAAARELGSTVAEAMSSAAVDGRRHGVVFDLGAGTYWIMAPQDPEDGAEPDEPPGRDDDPLAHAVALEPFSLHRGLRFAHVSFGGRKRTRGRVTVVFNPDGSGPPHAVCVTDDSGRAMTVVVNPYTTTVDFLQGEQDLDVFITED